jgi:hypothetical protein
VYCVISLGTPRSDRVTAGTLPDLLTVEEAAVLCRIGRNKAYGLARQWRATNGRCGLPVVEFGHTLRVPRHALEQMLGVEFTAWPLGSAAPACQRGVAPSSAAAPKAVDSPPAADVATSNVTPIRRLRARGESDQLPLFQPTTPVAEEP